MSFQLKNLVELTKLAIKYHASDIHIRSLEAPVLRIKGKLVPVNTEPFSVDDVLDIAAILSQIERENLSIDDINELDGAYELNELCRFRFNMFKYLGNAGIVLRIITNQIPTLESLKFPAAVMETTKFDHGLVLVTGATGSGKSTTLAAIINEINSHKAVHIVTLEDPVEYLHTQKKARITQRDIGIDSKSFSNALRAVLREDPDVILIGEMRDPETVEVALKAAETGHLVFSTLHTANAKNTIGRILSMFNGDNRDEIKKRLAETLQMTIGQKMMLDTTDKIVIAQEIMRVDPNIKDIITGKADIETLNNYIEKGYAANGESTSQTFDQHIAELYKCNIISEEVALQNADNPNNLEQELIRG